MKRRLKLRVLMILIAVVALSLVVVREWTSREPSYYIQGQVKTPARVPITGKVTVLDAINASGGLMTSLPDTNIRLVRIGTLGLLPSQTLPVDLAAILLKGDASTNYRLMPGDRLIVYRGPTKGPGATAAPPSNRQGPPAPRQ